MADSIWPMAIFAALPSAACRLVPQAWDSVTPGVSSRSFVPMTASRVRLKSLACVMTAPPTTSSMCSPSSLYFSTRPFSAAVIKSRFVRSS